MTKATVRDAVGVFHDETSLQAAVDELLIAGFDRSKLSLLADQDAVEKKLGHLYEKVADLEEDPMVPSRAFVGIDSRTEAKGAIIGGFAYVGAVASAGLVVATQGTLLATLIWAAVAGGAGGLIGAALSRYMDRRHAQYIQQQIDRGGILLWVRTEDAGRERRAVDILKRHSAADIHVFELPDMDYAPIAVSQELSFMKRLGL
jgi:outer membrane lipoprotein SlyB